jgi:hypothetical protein
MHMAETPTGGQHFFFAILTRTGELTGSVVDYLGNEFRTTYVALIDIRQARLRTQTTDITSHIALTW